MSVYKHNNVDEHTLHTLPAVRPMAGSTVRHEILSNSIIHLLLLLLSLFHPSIASYYGLISPPPPSFHSLPMPLLPSSSAPWTRTSMETLSQSPLQRTVSIALQTQLKSCWIQNYEPCFHDNTKLHSPVIMLLRIFGVLFLSWCVIITPFPPRQKLTSTLKWNTTFNFNKQQW